MTSALRRGRTLDPKAVTEAKHWREQRVAYLKAKWQESPLSLTRKERHELFRIGEINPAKLGA